MVKNIDLDFDLLDYSTIDSQIMQMEFSLAVNYRKIIINGIIDETKALKCLYFLNAG